MPGGLECCGHESVSVGTDWPGGSQGEKPSKQRAWPGEALRTDRKHVGCESLSSSGEKRGVRAGPGLGGHEPPEGGG